MLLGDFMKYSITKIKNYLTESKEDLEFKEFIKKINNIFGEDYALSLLTCNIDMNQSLKIFTSKFNSISSIHIESLLFQSAILSKKNRYNSFFSNKLDRDICFSVFQDFNKDMRLKKALIREFSRDCNNTNVELFDKIDNNYDKIKAVYNVKQVRDYEKCLKRQNMQMGLNRNVLIKRGNHF